MKLFISAAALLSVVLLSSCSSMYRTGQTPDDVYYSPGRASDLAHNQDREDDYSYVNPDDNYLRQKVQNRSRWSTIDDADYWYSYNRPYSNLYGFGYSPLSSPFYGNGLTIGLGNYYGFGNYGFGNYGYNNFGGYPFWNTFNYGYPDYSGYSGYGYGGLYGSHGSYGGYYPGTVILSGRGLRSNTGPKPYMGGFTNNTFNNSNNTQGRNDSRLGSFMRNAFGNGNNTSRPASTYDNNTSRPVRTFTPSSTPSYTPSSSSRGSSGASSGGSRPGRGGR